MNSSNKHTSFKIDRIESEVLNILNHTLKFIIYDEFLKEVSFTYVKIDSGCTIATIAVDTFNRSNIDKIVTKLNECKGIFRSELAKYMKVWKVPNIIFERDVTIDRAIQIEKALKEDVIVKRTITPRKTTKKTKKTL